MAPIDQKIKYVLSYLSDQPLFLWGQFIIVKEIKYFLENKCSIKESSSSLEV